MAKDLQESYRIGKILKKLTGLKFTKSRQKSNLSPRGKEKSESFYASREPIKKVPAKNQSESGVKKGEHNRFVQYQKELQAERLMGQEPSAKAPGKILKLPLNRKELMIKFDDEP